MKGIISLKVGRPSCGRYQKVSTALVYDFPRVTESEARHKAYFNILKTTKLKLWKTFIRKVP